MELQSGVGEKTRRVRTGQPALEEVGAEIAHQHAAGAKGGPTSRPSGARAADSRPKSTWSGMPGGIPWTLCWRQASRTRTSSSEASWWAGRPELFLVIALTTGRPAVTWSPRSEPKQSFRPTLTIHSNSRKHWSKGLSEVPSFASS